MSSDDDNWNKRVTNPSSLSTEEATIYPFGLKHKGYNNVVSGGNDLAQNWKFQGQEISEELGYNMYEFKYRHYDPTIGRFIQIDPLSESFSFQSHYNFAENEVIRGYELEGLEKVNSNDGERATEGTRGYYEANVSTREAGFSLRHPVVASKIGIANGSDNISSSASRFASRGATDDSPTSVLIRNASNENGEVNAFRHGLWQATITNKFGSDIASEVGASHEENPEADTTQRIFGSSAEADEVVDLLNNEIGRNIGEENPDANMNELAGKVLDVFKTDGLYTATKGKDGKFTISKTKISEKQYNALKKRFSELNNNGRTNREQTEHDKKKEQNGPDRRFGEW